MPIEVQQVLEEYPDDLPTPLERYWYPKTQRVEILDCGPYGNNESEMLDRLEEEGEWMKIHGNEDLPYGL